MAPAPSTGAMNGGTRPAKSSRSRSPGVLPSRRRMWTWPRSPPSCCGAGSTSGLMPQLLFHQAVGFEARSARGSGGQLQTPFGALNQERGQPGGRRDLSVAGDFSDHPAELHPDLQLGHVRHFVDREKSEGRRHDGVSHRVAPPALSATKKAPRNAGLKKSVLGNLSSRVGANGQAGFLSVCLAGVDDTLLGSPVVG